MRCYLGAINYEKENDELVIQNIANCINDKMSLLNIKLTELAKAADIDYFTLRKIVNRENGYMPNLRILIKLADYLNIKVGDLLNYSDLPQYIPLISKFQVFEFLDNKLTFEGFKDKVFSEKYIHDKAFAIKEQINNLLIPTEIIYICYPNQNNILTPNQVYLFKTSSELIFGQLKSSGESELEIIVNYETKTIEKQSTVATVISMQMSESFY